MNKQQRKLTIWFTVFMAILVAATTTVLTDAVYQSRLAQHGDIFDRVVSQQTWTWVQPMLISLGGAFLVGVVLFVGLWRCYAGDASADVEEILTTHPATIKSQSYWFGYLYAAFWVFVTYSCFTHTVVAIRVLSAFLGSPGHRAVDIQRQTALIAATILWPLMTLVFAWITYRLLVRKVTLRLIYILVGLHALNVLSEGIIPYKLVLFVVLSVIVVTHFREYFYANRPKPAPRKEPDTLL